MILIDSIITPGVHVNFRLGLLENHKKMLKKRKTSKDCVSTVQRKDPQKLLDLLLLREHQLEGLFVYIIDGLLIKSLKCLLKRKI